MRKQAESDRKIAALNMTQTANPRWVDEEKLRAVGYTDQEIADAFSMLPPSSKELIAEAEQAVQDIQEGKTPKLNQGADEGFMQRILKPTLHFLAIRW